MQMTLNSTDRIVTFNGVPARIWEGKSAGGVEVICFVTRVAVLDDADTSELDRELQQHAPPSAAAWSFPLAMVI